MSYWRTHLPFVFYAAGSVCFFVGSVIVMWRGR